MCVCAHICKYMYQNIICVCVCVCVCVRERERVFILAYINIYLCERIERDSERDSVFMCTETDAVFLKREMNKVSSYSALLFQGFFHCSKHF